MWNYFKRFSYFSSCCHNPSRVFKHSQTLGNIYLNTITSNNSVYGLHFSEPFGFLSYYLTAKLVILDIFVLKCCIKP